MHNHYRFTFGREVNWFAKILTFGTVCFVVTTIGLLMLDGDIGETSPEIAERVRTLTDVKITGITSDSGLNYTIETSRARQYPEQEISKLDAPKVMQVLAEGQTRTISADTGVYYEASETIVLTGNVSVTESGNGADSPLVTNTDTLTIELGKIKD